jgi:tRNA threonylcarbamoyladenosine biosynthesis protein TsaB
MTWTLGIDCSSARMSLGLYADRHQAGELSQSARNTHAEQIAEGVGSLLASGGISAADISRVGVAVGPGSFTGLRIAVSFIKGFCLTRPVRVLPVSSLRSVAVALGRADGTVAVAFDARRDEVFWARFACGADGVRRTGEDRLSPAAEFAASMRPGELVATDTLGNARSRVFAFLAEHDTHRSLDAEPCPRGPACAGLAAAEPEDSSRWCAAVDVLPRYFRPSYAEERRAARTDGVRA